MRNHSLVVRNFAQIRKADIQFGDLTILVGPQASGKSLLLQLWKLGQDQREIVSALRDAGDDISSPEALLEAVLGQGMGSAWRDNTTIELNDETLIAIGNFCGEHKIDPPTDGRVSDEFRQKLKEVYEF